MKRHGLAAAVVVWLGAAVVWAAPLPSGTGGPLRAGTAEGRLRVPVGTPLGGYLRPPVGGDYLADFEGELFDNFPNGVAHDGTPLQPLPDELRTLHSPYATYFPPSRGYYDSLVTKAVALTDGEDWVVLVKNDLIGMLDEVVVSVRERVKAETGIELGDGLILSATHTHDGPGALANLSVRYFWLAMDAYQPELFERLVANVTAIVLDAMDPERMVRARFGYGSGLEAERGGILRVNSFRRSRSPYTQDRVDQQNAVRRRIGVLRVDEIDGTTLEPVRPLAVVFNYPAHGIAFGVENMFFSGDVMGAAERELAMTFDEPVVSMSVQSTGGDVSPRTDGGPTLQRIERFGKLLAPQVRAIYDGITTFDDRPELEALSQRVILDRERLGYEGTEYPYPWGAAQCNSTDIPEGCLPGHPPDAIDLVDNGVGENGAFLPTDTIVTAVRIGSAVLLAQPGEPLVEYGLRVLEASPFGFDDTFIWGYSQDHIGYILPDLKADWMLGGTEGTTTFWGWKQGGRLLEVNQALMSALAGDAPPPEDEVEIAYQSYPAVPPPAIPSLRPGRVVLQPTDVERFATTTFAWEGGDPVVDLPVTVLEREAAPGVWEPVRRQNGEIMNTYFEMHLEYEIVSAAHQWTVEFEPPKDWPTGTYRFRVEGIASSGAYAIASAPFTVSPSPSLVVSDPVRDGGEVEVTLAYTPRPDNYRVIDPEVPSDVPAPVRDGRVTFSMPSGEIADDTPTVEDRDGRLVAVYAVTSAENPVSVRGEDVWNNTTP